DDLLGDVVAVQCGLQRGGVPAGLRVEPVALQDGVVERRVGIDGAPEQSVQRLEREGTIRLVTVRGKNRAVLPVGDRDVGAGRKAYGRVLHVGGGQRCVRVVRARGKSARQREQVLALGVEDMFLLAIQLFDGKAVNGKLGVAGHPLLNGGQW